MSDGPHKSLNMSRRWKHLAERADNRAYSLDEVAKAYLPVLDKSCREEVPLTVWRELARIFAGEQQMLFAEQHGEEIRALRQQVAGQPLGCSLVDLAELAASKGPLNEGNPRQRNDASADAARGARQQTG
ncbi:MAG: hypothetical protein WDO12_01660 [Pseudomonadota bacterium]